MRMKRQTCDNCYNCVTPTVGRLVPQTECLEHEPERGQDTARYQRQNGQDCPYWQPQMQVLRRRHI